MLLPAAPPSSSIDAAPAQRSAAPGMLSSMHAPHAVRCGGASPAPTPLFISASSLCSVGCVVAAVRAGRNRGTASARSSAHGARGTKSLAGTRPVVALQAQTRSPEGSTSSGSLPDFVSILSTKDDWQSAVVELAAEAATRSGGQSGKKWDFGVVFVNGHDGVLVAEIAKALDEVMGMQGNLIGVAVDSNSGILSSGKEYRSWSGRDSGISLLAMRTPENDDGKATPFFLDKQGLIMGVSPTIMRLQSRVRVRGSQESATPRGWRAYFGVEEVQQRPKGILLFVDPLASKWVVQSVLDGLDMAYPEAVKFGCVCRDLPPSMTGLAANIGGAGFKALGAGVAGLLLPSSISLHAVASPATVRVGEELRLTQADGQVVVEINGQVPMKALAAVGDDAGQLEKFLIDRAGFLLGLEAPRQMDTDFSKVWDGGETWGSSDRAPSYGRLMKQACGSDWLVRSIEPLPDGRLVIRRDDLKRVPPRVGPSWLRCQLHVQDLRQARKELQLMLQRYLGARLFLPGLTPPVGALVCACSTTTSQDSTDPELGMTEIREVFGDELPIAGLLTHGELVPPGISIGGLDRKRTTRQGHTVSLCFFSYQPNSQRQN